VDPAPAGEIGAVVDGQAGFGPFAGFRNDATFVASGSSIVVGLLEHSGDSNVVCVFGGRPVGVLKDAGWTPGSDAVHVTLAPPIRIPISVWILVRPFRLHRFRAYVAKLVCNRIWSREHVGVRLGKMKVHDATGAPAAASLRDFACKKRGRMQEFVGRDEGRINVYFVDRVDGKRNAGVTCIAPADFVALGSCTGPDLLVHELGHCFYLFHVDDTSDDREEYGSENVMAHTSLRRCYFTEGQIFRALLYKQSAINFLYHSRSGQPVWDATDPGDFFVVPGADGSLHRFPPLRKRVWADGSRGPN